MKDNKNIENYDKVPVKWNQDKLTWNVCKLAS